MRPLLQLCAGVLLVLMATWPIELHASAMTEVKIGVLSFRSKDQTLKRWEPTADYLSRSIPGHTFRIVPMFYPELEAAAKSNGVDFILTNSGHYVTLTIRHGVSRLATLIKNVQGTAVGKFGGIIFTRADRTDINSFQDLKGKTFTGVGKLSLGGFLVAWKTLLDQGIDPFNDFAKLDFSGMPHDGVVVKVLNGETDAGTVRTSILENMAREGRVDLSDIKVLNPQSTKGFPVAHSTALYPEWPFSALKGTPQNLSKAVLSALLSIPAEHEAALAGHYMGGRSHRTTAPSVN